MLGVLEVTFNVPAVTVYVLAMPNIALPASWREVPLSVTLYKLAVPLNEEAPVKVTVPAEAVKLPPTFKLVETAKLMAVEIVPLTDNVPNKIVPAPEIVFEVPLIATEPLEAVSVPLADRFPVTVIELDVEIVPLMVKLSKINALPLMVFDVPFIVKVPPADCVKFPTV